MGWPSTRTTTSGVRSRRVKVAVGIRRSRSASSWLAAWRCRRWGGARCRRGSPGPPSGSSPAKPGGGRASLGRGRWPGRGPTNGRATRRARKDRWRLASILLKRDAGVGLRRSRGGTRVLAVGPRGRAGEPEGRERRGSGERLSASIPHAQAYQTGFLDVRDCVSSMRSPTRCARPPDPLVRGARG